MINLFENLPHKDIAKELLSGDWYELAWDAQGNSVLRFKEGFKYAEALMHVFKNNNLTKHEVYLKLMNAIGRIELYRNGLKVIKPTLKQCIAMGEIRPHIQFEDYTQPYDAFAIELPQEYITYLRQNYQKRIPQVIGCVFWKRWSWLMCTLYYNKNELMMYEFVSKYAEDPTLEQHIENVELQYEASQDVPLLRIAINISLFSTNFGHVPFGYENEKQYKAVQRRDPDEAAKIPYYFGLKQEIPIRRESYQKSKPGDGTRKSPHPHWRKGHRRSQRYGKGRQEVKRIFIPPVFVMKDDFEGDIASTNVIMS